jgi:uncharacterized protein (TIGR03437 family)
MFSACVVLLASFAPFYTSASIVNAASYRSNALAPNTFISIFGTEMSFATRGIEPGDIAGGELPTSLLNTNVRVSVRGILAHLLYVSPTQINALIPSNLLPGPADIGVFRNGVWGPLVSVELRPQAPALFQADAATAIATHADGSLVTREHPAAAGEVIVLYCTGLGATVPPQRPGQLAVSAAQIAQRDQLSILLAGETLPAQSVEYAGITPGFAGLYQINLRLPLSAPCDPEIQVQIGEDRSPEGLRLLYCPTSPQPSVVPPR